MRKLVLSAGAALVVLGSVGSADAQYRYGYYGGWGYGPYVYRRSDWSGGALAVGLIGSLALGGIAAAAATPAYAYPPYAYGYGYAPTYYGGYYPSAIYGTGYVYSPAPLYSPGTAYSPDLYAAPHEVRGGYRTVYVPGGGRRVIVGGPLY